jgi:ribosomal protein S18 acetylase RimI-like enzyme
MGTAHCWCMWWRHRGKSHAANRTAMRRLVKSGAEPGLLGYEEGRPVGWISIAPKAEYGHLSRSRSYASDDDEGVWSIACITIAAEARHRGAHDALVRAAVEHALARGARAVEAYPHRRRPDYMGYPSPFERARFGPVREAGPRLVMRRMRG